MQSVSCGTSELTAAIAPHRNVADTAAAARTFSNAMRVRVCMRARAGVRARVCARVCARARVPAGLSLW